MHMTKIVTKYTRQQFDIHTCHFGGASVSWPVIIFAMAKKLTCYLIHTMIKTEKE